MAIPAFHDATYADLKAAPGHLTAELIDGALVTRARPMPYHAIALTALAARLASSFQTGLHGPGGWIFLWKPEIHLDRQVVVPDIAGWRRERLQLLRDAPYVTAQPDFVCELSSDAIEYGVRAAKQRIYAAAEVSHLWLLDPRRHTLEVFELKAGQWCWLSAVTGNDEARAAPFDAISFSLGLLWPFDPPDTDHSED